MNIDNQQPTSKMKHFVIIAVMAMLVSAAGYAQEQKDRCKFSPQEFMHKRDEFIANKAGLTAKEATSLFPIYHEIERKKFDIDRKIGKLMHDGNRPNINEKEAQKILAEIDRLQLEKARLDNTFHQKGRKVAASSKILRVMHADWEFSRHVLKEMSKPKPENPRPPQRQ